MLEYRTFCYLQNQKTGCTFVEAFLRKFAAEPMNDYVKHSPVPRRDPSKFYFINVREPLELYRSLYAYGLDGRGTVFQRLRRQGRETLYAGGKAGFSQWLRFALDPVNATLLSDEYTPAVAANMGFMTWRFYRLAVMKFEAAAPKFSSKLEMGNYVNANFFMNAVLKQETLRDDLSLLVKRHMTERVKSVPDALAWIAQSPRVNVSQSISDAQQVPVDDDALGLLFGKERSLYRNCYPEVPAFAQWRAAKKE